MVVDSESGFYFFCQISGIAGKHWKIPRGVTWPRGAAGVAAGEGVDTCGMPRNDREQCHGEFYKMLKIVYSQNLGAGPALTGALRVSV